MNNLEYDYRTPDMSVEAPYKGPVGLPITAFVLSIIGFFTGCFLVGIVLDFVAIILGIVSLFCQKNRKSFSMAAIYISIASIIITIIFYILMFCTDSFQDIVWKTYREQLQPTSDSKSYTDNLLKKQGITKDSKKKTEKKATKKNTKKATKKDATSTK